MNFPAISPVMFNFAFWKQNYHETIAFPNDTSAWPVANKAFYCEIFLPFSFTFTKLGWINHNAPAGNIDVAIYNGATLAKIVSTGSVAQAGSQVIQSVSVGSTTIGAGKYLLAMSKDTATGNPVKLLMNNVTTCDAARCFEQTSAFPLPSTAAPVSQTANFFCPIVFLIPATF